MLRLKTDETKFKEVEFLRCDAINTIRLPKLGGEVTIFYMNFSVEMHLFFDRMILDMKLNVHQQCNLIVTREVASGTSPKNRKK